MEAENPAPPHRRRLWVAVAATAVALPLLLLDNLNSTDRDDPARTTSVTARVATAVAPRDRPESGPPKGISVVTSSTTSSTVPITALTTTTGAP